MTATHFTDLTVDDDLIVLGDATITGSTTITGTLTADITGDVTGDVTGDLTGDVTGDLTGNVTGDSGNCTYSAIGTVSATGAADLFIAPADVTITGLKITVTTGITGNDVNYWSVKAVNKTATEDLSSATVDTTSGVDITADTGFDITIDQNADIDEGEVIQVSYTKAASAADLVNLAASVAWETR
jgi:hypothetical protein